MRTGERIAKRRIEAGMSQSALAKAAGISQPTIGKLEAGISSGSSHLHRIAQVLGTTPAYLACETDDPSEGAVPIPSKEALAEHFDLVPLVEVDISYGMGAAFMDDAPVVTVRQFPKEWLASITASPSSSLFIARGRGSSMEPTLRDGDMLIIDRSERQVRDQDELWAFTIGEIGMIKRLRVRGEKVTILSDSTLIPEDYAHPDEINVVGRVVFIGRKM